MQIPNATTGNLYQYITVMGFSVCCLAILGISQRMNNSHTQYEKYLEHYFSAEDDNQKKFWNELIKKQSEVNSDESLFLITVGVIGFLLFLIGVWHWYSKYQYQLDKKLEIERKLAENKLEETEGSKTIKLTP